MAKKASHTQEVKKLFNLSRREKQGDLEALYYSCLSDIWRQDEKKVFSSPYSHFPTDLMLASSFPAFPGLDSQLLVGINKEKTSLKELEIKIILEHCTHQKAREDQIS